MPRPRSSAAALIGPIDLRVVGGAADAALKCIVAAPSGEISLRQNVQSREDAPWLNRYVFAGVGGYYGGNEGNLAGVFRRDAEGAEWTHVL